MGVYQAMQAAVTGLRGNSLALEHISGNISNSRTTGFKRTESYFVDLIPSDTATLQRSSGTLAFARGTMDVQGGLTNSYRETHMAINGDGYFTVEAPVSLADGYPTFYGTDNFTRRGDFDLDKNGYLVNGAGYYLKGLDVDRTTGNVAGTLPDIIQLDTGNLQPKATSSLTYELNIPVTPLTADGNGIWDPTAADGVTGVGQSQITTDNEQSFLDASITGGAITVYNPNGAPINMQFRWAQDSADPTQYHLYQYKNDKLNVNGGRVGGTGVIWEQMGTAQFDATGALTTLTGVDHTVHGAADVTGGANATGQAYAGSGAVAAASQTSISIPGTGGLGGGDAMIIDGVEYIGDSTTAPYGDITLNFGLGGLGLTNFADSDGQVTINDLGQNGYGSGEFVEVTITSENRIRALYSNGVSIDQAEIQLTRFNADNNLRRLDGGVFLETSESGPPIAMYGTSGATLNGGTLESSNVDIADEFTKLIVTQQAYAANTRIVSTSDEMLQEVLNMKR